MSPTVDTILLERISKAPIDILSKALQVDSLAAFKRLQANGINGISIERTATLEVIWTNNETNIMEVFDLITDN